MSEGHGSGDPSSDGAYHTGAGIPKRESESQERTLLGCAAGISDHLHPPAIFEPDFGFIAQRAVQADEDVVFAHRQRGNRLVVNCASRQTKSRCASMSDETCCTRLRVNGGGRKPCCRAGSLPSA